MYGRRARYRDLTIVVAALLAVAMAGRARGQAAADVPEAADASDDVGQQIADNLVNPTAASRPFNGSADGLKKVRYTL